MEGSVVQEESVHPDERNSATGCRERVVGGFDDGCKTERAGIDQCVLSAVAHKKAVDSNTDRQVLFAFVSAIEMFRRMMEGREVYLSEVYIPVGFLVSDSESFLQHRFSRRRNTDPYCYSSKQQQDDTHYDTCERQGNLPY